jgi:hypothetical protein
MKKILILIVTITVIISCSKDGVNNLSGLKIRLSNASQHNFENIVINTTTGDVNFGNLSSGQKTVYKVFNKAYRYAFIKLEIDGKTYTIQPIDYVGETALKNGSYTYQIDANDTQDQYANLNMTLIEE